MQLEGEDLGLGVCKEEVGAAQEGEKEDGSPCPPRPTPSGPWARWQWLGYHGLSPEVRNDFYRCEEKVERLCIR